MIGLVTADAAADHDPDLVPLAEALRALLGDEQVRIVSWHDDAVSWGDFDAAVIRSTWDYIDRLDEFLGWVDRVAAQTLLLNGADTVRWNCDKRYLDDLRREGIPIVPTTFVAPGEAVPAEAVAGTGPFVVKPTVGAGSNGAKRCRPDEVAAHVATLHADGRTAMIQPYLDLLDELGETEHCFVPSADGRALELSHAFGKAALLAAELVRVGDLFAHEEITPRTPREPELVLANAVLATRAVRSLGPLAFARIDIAPILEADGSTSFAVMELELIEPSFSFWTADQSAQLFASRLLALCAAHGVEPGPVRVGR